jgi:hypothetical protein
MQIVDLISNGYIANSPFEAVARIRKAYRCTSEQIGMDCSGINALRGVVEQFAFPYPGLQNAVLICAPHTHWGSEPIVESFGSEGKGTYTAGPAATIDPTLLPISWVVSDKGVLAYEWADSSVPVCSRELKLVEGAVHLIGEIIKRLGPLPHLGLTVSHRFKKSIWDPQLLSFAEGPSEGDAGRATIDPCFIRIEATASDFDEFIQVAWSARFPTREAPRELEVRWLSQVEGALELLPVAQIPSSIELLRSTLNKH